MPKPKQETENDLCRCCHSEGAYKNLYASYSWVDVEEVVYSKLLQECFDIELAKVTQPLQNMLCTICDTCIERLQDAIKFKRQVQKCEKRFRDVYGSCVGEEATFEVKVKQEVDMDVKDDSLNGMHAHSSVMASSFQMMDDSEGCSGRDDDDDGFKPDGGVKVKVEMDDSDSEDDIVLKDISEAKKRRGEPSRAAKTTPATSSKKSKKDGDGEIEVIQGISVVRVKTPIARRNIDYKVVGNEYHCLRCPAVVVRKNNASITYHVKNVHFNTARYKCPICLKLFWYLCNVVKHKYVDHKIDERYKCNACEKTFFNIAYLKNHNDRFHMLGNKLKCTECELACRRALRTTCTVIRV